MYGIIASDEKLAVIPQYDIQTQIFLTHFLLLTNIFLS